MKSFLWCSVHQPTTEQLAELSAQGDVQFLKELNPQLQSSLNATPPDIMELSKLAIELTEYGFKGYTLVQPGGSPAFLYMFGRANTETNFPVLFAHSERVSEDVPQEDGSVRKVSVFRHVCFF